MGFLQEQTVIHIKLTDKGRELLSRGKLKFEKFALGDSEIDYEFVENSGIDIENSAILRPYDSNPNIASFIPRNDGGDVYTNLVNLPNNTTTVTNTIEPKGFFIKDNAQIDPVTNKPRVTLFSDAAHVKQPAAQVVTAAVNGGRQIILTQTSEYIAGSAEPVVGDYVLIKWANRDAVGATTPYLVNYAVPYLFYKIEEIVSGTLESNNLTVLVDRDLPDFSSVSHPFVSGAMIYPNNNNRKVSGDSIQTYYGAPFVTDFVSESMISFLENYDTPTIDVPVWNMTIIFTEDIIGVNPVIERGFGGNISAQFGGIVRYLQRVEPKVPNVGLIHYTNNSPSNNYGEGLVLNDKTTPVLDLPTIMWHKTTGNTMGLRLIGDNNSLATLPDLNTKYANLVDEAGNVVGKVFPDLKLFMIEDQELLFAMSYKSNRNWTLPQINADFNATLCPESDVQIVVDDVIIETTTTTTTTTTLPPATTNAPID